VRGLGILGEGNRSQLSPG